MEYSVSSVLSLISRIHSKSQNFLHKKMAENGLPDLATSHGFILFCLSKGALLSLEDGLAANAGNMTGALIRLYKALGGGWAPLSPEDTRYRVPDAAGRE